MNAPGSDGDPFSFLFGSGRELAYLLGLVLLAVPVFWYGSRQLRQARGSQALGPRGRWSTSSGRRKREAQWARTVALLEGRDPTPIAEARQGPVRIVGTLVRASGDLGGPPERACVWRNRAGARPESAVGAELVIVADESGRCGVEGLERATVVAPSDKHSLHHEHTSLYLGDELEIIGVFEPESVPEGEAPAEQVYGTLGADGALEVRLRRRPDPPAPDPPTTSEDPS